MNCLRLSNSIRRSEVDGSNKTECWNPALKDSKVRRHLQGLIQASDVQGIVMANKCIHLNQVREVTPHTDGCKECLENGDDWVHLRLCLTCGHVGCCDDSNNKHASAHFHSKGHPIIESLEPGEDWRWCFVDEIILTPEAESL